MTFHEIHVNARRVLHFIIVATSPDVRLIQAIGFVDPKLEHTWIHLDLDGIVIPSIFNRLAAKVLPIHAVEAVRALEESASGVPRGDEVLTDGGGSAAQRNPFLIDQEGALHRTRRAT